MISNVHLVARRLLVLSAFGPLLCGQSPGTPPPEPAAATAASAPIDSGIHADPASKAPVPTPEDKHIFGVLPNYRTAEASQIYTPITVRQKFNIAKSDTLDGPGFVIAGVLSGIYQLQNQNPSFGQGLKGYAHRYVTAYGDQAIGNMMTEGVMPSLLREDPRYFRMGKGSAVRRTFHAVFSVMETRTDHGRDTFNITEWMGNGVDASIGNTYYPDERGFVDTMNRLGTDVATDALSDVLKEFWQDFKKHVLHKRSTD